METNSIDRLTQALEQSQRVCAQMIRTADEFIEKRERAIALLER